jgi:hypothetical protein
VNNLSKNHHLKSLQNLLRRKRPRDKIRKRARKRRSHHQQRQSRKKSLHLQQRQSRKKSPHLKRNRLQNLGSLRLIREIKSRLRSLKRKEPQLY